MRIRGTYGSGSMRNQQSQHGLCVFCRCHIFMQDGFDLMRYPSYFMSHSDQRPGQRGDGEDEAPVACLAQMTPRGLARTGRIAPVAWLKARTLLPVLCEEFTRLTETRLAQST